jgi:hypothetical protein
MWYHPPAPRVERDGACGETIAETGMDALVRMLVRRSDLVVPVVPVRLWACRGVKGSEPVLAVLGVMLCGSADPDRTGV